MNNIFNKAILIIIVLFTVFFNSTPVLAQQSFDTVNVTRDTFSQGFENFTRLNLIVSELKLTDNSFKYQAGSRIKGSFKITNITNYYAAGLYYQVNLHKSSQDIDSSPIFGLDRSTIYDFTRSEAFNIVPGEEQTLSFSYSIPENLPAGDLYYLEISVHTSKEEFLGNVKQKVSIVNDQQPHFIVLDPKTSLIFGKERIYSIYEGPTFDYDKEYHPVKDIGNIPVDFMNPDQKYEPSEGTLKNLIKVKLSLTNLGEEIKKPKLKMTTYRYGFPFDKPAERTIERTDIKKDSSGYFELMIPIPEGSGAYETFIQFYDGEKKISNSLEVVHITSGNSGLIYSFLVEKKDSQNYIFRVMATPPADNMQSEAIMNDYVEKVFLKAKEKNTGKVCWEVEKEINLKNTSTLEVPFTASCSEPIVFSAELKKDGKTLDSQTIFASSSNKESDNDKLVKKGELQSMFERNSIIKFGFIGMGVIILVLIIWLVIKKRKNSSGDSSGKMFSILFFALVITGLGFSKQSLAFGSPSLLSPASGTEVTTTSVTFSWTRPNGFVPGGGNYYQLVFTNGGSFTTTSESLSLSAANIPMGSGYWYVQAIQGYYVNNNYCQYCVGEYGSWCGTSTSYGSCNYLDIYSPSCCSVQLSYDSWTTGTIVSENYHVVTGTTNSNSFSIIRNKPMVVPHPYHSWTPYYSNLNGFSGVSAVNTYKYLIDTPGNEAWGGPASPYQYTMRFINNPSDGCPDNFTFCWGYLYYNIFDQNGISYNGIDNFLIKEERTTFPLYAYGYLYGGGCPNAGKGSYINFFIVDQSGNMVKDFSIPWYWYSFFNTVWGDRQRWLQLPINDLNLNAQYYLVIQQNYYQLGSGETHFTYIPFMRGGLPTLTVTKAGNGSGTVTSTDGKINCGSTCSANYTNGANTPVILNAVPSDLNSTFTGWGGDCTGTGLCNLTMNSAKNVTANFTCACNDSGSRCTGETYINSCGMTCTGTMPSLSGQCGSAADKLWEIKPNSNLCSVGTASDPTSSESQWCWNCSGICGGNVAKCCAQRDSNWKEIAP